MERGIQTNFCLFQSPLGKPQKVLKITNMQNCGFLQGKAGFAQFYFQKLSRFYLDEFDGVILQNNRLLIVTKTAVIPHLHPKK